VDDAMVTKLCPICKNEFETEVNRPGKGVYYRKQYCGRIKSRGMFQTGAEKTSKTNL